VGCQRETASVPGSERASARMGAGRTCSSHWGERSASCLRAVGSDMLAWVGSGVRGDHWARLLTGCPGEAGWGARFGLGAGIGPGERVAWVWSGERDAGSPAGGARDI